MQDSTREIKADSPGRNSSRKTQNILLATVGVILCCGGFIFCAKMFTPDYLNEEEDADTPKRSSTKTAETNSEKLALTKPSNKPVVNRSQLIDMAILRGKQMDRLGYLDANLDNAMKGVDPSKTGKDHLDKQYALVDFDYARRKKRFGDEHPYTIETAIDKLLLSEQLGINCETETENAIENWLKFEKKLSAHALHPEIKNTDTNELDRMGQRKLWKWGHDTGEILALLSWGHRKRQQAMLLVDKLAILSGIPAYKATDGRVAVHQELDLARLCASQNEYAESKRILGLAKQLAAKQRSVGIYSNQHSVAMCLLEESRLSLAERDYGQAEDLARQAGAIAERTLDMEQMQSKALRADILEQLARSLAVSPAKISEAIQNQEKCLALRKEEFGKDGTFTSSTALDLARMLHQRAALSNKEKTLDAQSPDLVKEKDLLNKILQVCQSNQQSDNELLRADRNVTLLLPQTYFELGCLQSACGKLKEGRDNLQKAADINMTYTEPLFIPRKIADLDALSAIDLLEGKTSSARALVQKSSSLLDAYVADVLPQLSLAEQIGFTDNIEKHINSILAVCKDDESLADLYSEMIRWKGFLTEEFRLRSKIIKEKAIPSINKLLASHQKLSSKLLSTYVEATQTGSSMGKQVLEEQAQKEEIERHINAQLKNSLKESLTISSKDLRSTLGRNEALIDLYEFAMSPWDNTAHYGAIVSTNAGHHWVDLGPCQKINEALENWRSYGGVRTVIPEINSSSQKADSASANSWEQLRALLYDRLLKAVPANATQIWISDESELTRLPWNVLFSSYGGTRAQETCQVDSPRELINLKRHISSAGRDGILIVGGIDYSKHVPPAPPLKHALSELEEIQKEMKAEKIACNVQSDFLQTPHPTRKNIMDGLAKCRMAHIVTHGFFNESDSVAGASDRSAKISNEIASGSETRTSESFQIPARNPLIESGLLISKSANDSGFLTAEDLLDANLEGCKLVTLSACETARGREISSQGVLGLRSSLMGAGSRSVLLSLWPVPDKPTSELMKAFYKRLLAGDTAAAALKQAQAAVRKKDPQWQAPYYWAAWILVGDGWDSISQRQ